MVSSGVVASTAAASPTSASTAPRSFVAAAGILSRRRVVFCAAHSSGLGQAAAASDLLLEHLDEGEDSVGTHVSIDHLAATPMGLEVQIKIEIAEVDRRKVAFSFSVKDSIEEVGRANLSLQALHHGAGVTRDQRRILGVALVGAAPAVVARQVPRSRVPNVA